MPMSLPIPTPIAHRRAGRPPGVSGIRTPRKRRVLLVAESVSLAHVARMIRLARALDPRRYEITLACDDRYQWALDESTCRCVSLSSTSPAAFQQALASGQPLYSLDTLRGYLRADVQLLQEVQPDLVVGDFRLSLSASARLAGVAYAAVVNSYWSPHAKLRFVVPDLPIVKLMGRHVAQRVFDALRPRAFRKHAEPLNLLRREVGLAALDGDLKNVYCDGDHVLYADLPDFAPMERLPAHHHFLGALPWSTTGPLPPWWDDLPKDRPVVYLTLGSSGPAARVLPRAIAALASMPVSVVMATAGRVQLDRLPANMWAADYLPGETACNRSSMVINNGGSLGCYQALAAGRPVVGLPSNLDQHLNMECVTAQGVGVALRAASTNSRSLQQAVTRLLGKEATGYTHRVEALRHKLVACDPSRRFAQFVSGVLG